MKANKMNWKGMLPDVICVVLFVLISFLYFYPADIDGRRLMGHDHSANDGLTVEVNNYRAEHNGETPRWMNSIFSGMPTYQIAPSYGSTDTLRAVENAYHLWLPDYVWYIFASMLGFYILLRAFDFRQWMAALGAVVWAFSSYFLIIIAAGHIWKVMTLAYIPPTIAGVVLCYRGRLLWGGIVTTLFAALQISANHLQMTYYFLFPLFFMFVAYLVDAIREHWMPRFLKATGVLVAAAAVAVAINGSNLYHTYKYANETMRGKSELVKQGKESDQTDSGLERSYITNWSYGIDETLTLLIPNFRGGASTPLVLNESLMKKADSSVNPQYFGYFTEYWGEQPGTSGPVYVGAIVCLLFVLALLILPNKSTLKWALVAATILSILLAWGKNFMGLTDFFIDHVPLYAKFRTVASILVIAEFTIPLLALLGLKEFVSRCADKAQRPRMLRALTTSAVITGGICLLLAVFPSLAGNYISDSGDAHSWSYLSNDLQNSYLKYALQQNPDDVEGAKAMAMQFAMQEKDAVFANLPVMRRSLLTSDAWRSLGIIILGFVLMYWFFRRTVPQKDAQPALQKSVTLLCISLLVVTLFDLWSVNKRYLNDGMFQVPQAQLVPEKTPADDVILAQSGNGRNYRVFDQSHFADNMPAFRYASIGGYHAAKLRRYQELIDEHIAPVDRSKPMNMEVINMLNTQWVIGTDPQTGQRVPMQNPDAFGNAWLVDTLLFVQNANEELDALHHVSPRRVAVVDKVFADAIGQEPVPPISEGDTIVQTSLTSTTVAYDVQTKNGGLAVFSEIYYPDWTAVIDGQPASIARADYVLRTMRIPAGKHHIEMTFDPQSVHTTETIAYIALALLALAVLAFLFFTWRKHQRD